MSTGKLTGILVMAMMIAPVLVWGQDKQKTDSLFKALAVAQKKARFILLFDRNNKLFSEKPMQVIESEIKKMDKEQVSTLRRHQDVSGRFFCGYKNVFKQ